MPRIAVDLRSVHPGLTGIGRYALNLALSLESLGEELEVCPITSEIGARYLAGHSSLRALIVDTRDPLLDSAVLPDLLEQVGADLYHSPLVGLPSISVCPMICTLHDAIPLVRPDLCPASFAEFFRLRIAGVKAAASHIVTVSEHSRRDLLRTIDLEPGRITAIHEPVSPFFSPSERTRPLPEELGLSEGYLLSVGAIDRRKNLNALLDAVAILLRSRSETPPLVVVGGPSGDGYDLAQEVGRRRLQSQVRAVGRVPDALLARLYAHAGVFVFPSWYEGFGLPVLEAMASGTPVVAAATSSIPEVAGEAALLVDPSDSAAMAEAIGRLLDDPGLRHELSRRGLARASEFSLQRQARQLADLYERVSLRAAA